MTWQTDLGEIEKRADSDSCQHECVWVEDIRTDIPRLVKFARLLEEELTLQADDGSNHSERIQELWDQAGEP